MREVRGNLWTYPATWRCITTNGFIKKNGAAVMGAGCAKAAKEMYLGIDYILGKAIGEFGNVPINLSGCKTFSVATNDATGADLWTFPVKHHWEQDADPNLIMRSAKILRYIWHMQGEPGVVVIPRPGCGNGRLDWNQVVKPRLSEILIEDAWHIIDFG